MNTEQKGNLNKLVTHTSLKYGQNFITIATTVWSHLRLYDETIPLASEKYRCGKPLKIKTTLQKNVI